LPAPSPAPHRIGNKSGPLAATWFAKPLAYQAKPPAAAAFSYAPP